MPAPHLRHLNPDAPWLGVVALEPGVERVRIVKPLDGQPIRGDSETHTAASMRGAVYRRPVTRASVAAPIDRAVATVGVDGDGRAAAGADHIDATARE